MASAGPFYAQVLGTRSRTVDMDGGAYTLLEVDGDPVAGAMAAPPGEPSEWTVYFEVDDCDKAHSTAVGLGAVSRLAPTDSPAGRFALLADPQGAPFAVIRSDPDFSL